MGTDKGVFKDWVPKWLIRGTIVSILAMSLLGFALYYSNMESAIGYYGFEQVDIQYSVVLMYATVIAFLALDNRLIKYFIARDYIVLGLVLDIISYIVCFYTRDIILFMICRFLQGIACALLCSVVLNLVFSLFHKPKSKVFGYSIFYGGLQISIPVCAIYCSWLLHFKEFNYLFYGLNISILFTLVLVFITMKRKARFYKKIPLYQIDWIGAILYTAFCALLGYLLVYAQKLNWFESKEFTRLTFVAFILLVLFVTRQLLIKRPLINLSLFKYKSFIIGLLLLVALYIFKGTVIFVYVYIEHILDVDPIHMTPVWIMNIIGIIVGSFVTARYIIYRAPLINIIIVGFSLLALFHLIMYFTFSSSVEITFFYIPIFIYGLGTSTLFVPVVVFTVSTVPEHLAYNVSFIGIFSRFVGFCAGLSINNYFQSYTKSEIFERFRENVNETNYMLGNTLNSICNDYLSNNQDYMISNIMSDKYLKNLISGQILIKSTMDYFGIVFISILVCIVLLFISPTIKKVAIRIRERFIPY